jgi:hypothetical protein
MDDKPEALLLAECLDEPQYLTHRQAARAAAELRRLYEVNAELLEALKVLLNNNEALTGENIARAAIAKAEEK